MRKVALYTTLSILVSVVVFAVADDDDDCDCDWVPGGCVIDDAAPRGYKCYCQKKAGENSCTETLVKCSQFEMQSRACQGECYSKSCCLMGGSDANCGGYWHMCGCTYWHMY